MNRSSLFAELKKHPWILAVVILAHIGLAILLSINMSHDDKPPMPAAKKHDIIDAVAVDARLYDDRKKQKELEEKRKRDQVLAEKKRQQELARKKALEKKSLEKKRLEEKKQAEKKLAEKKLAERKRQEQLKREKERVEKEKQLALARKKEQEKKERLERERLEKERVEKERLAKLEAERKRKEEEARRRAEEKAELERAVLEEEQRREAAARQAERAARLQTMREQYIIAIAQHVESYWRRPVGNVAGQSCEVMVTQLPSGDVVDVRVQSCNSDSNFQQSVERAVLRASPLPTPRDPELFERQIYFKFKPRT